MVRSEIRLVFSAVLLLLLVCVSGCGTLDVSNFSKWSDLFGSKSSVRNEEEHRQKYQSSRDPAALRWLLAHQIHSGMSVSEVGRVIGEEGRRLYNDDWVKKGGGYYQSGDEAWKWEQDRNGQSLILVFREGRLVNFDPSDYSDQPDSAGF
jgi:hypothetical protein